MIKLRKGCAEMKNDRIFDILTELVPPARDNGRRFTVCDRLSAIQELLWNSKYRRVNPQGLFHLYSAKPLDKIKGPVLLVSSHIDTPDGAGRCFLEEEDGVFTGTADAAAVNAALLSVMLDSELPDNVLIAFTGGRNADFNGALQAAEYLRSMNISADIAAVLDITLSGVSEGADLTIENNFWDDEEGGKLIGLIRSLTTKWYFVPADVKNIPSYVYPDRVIHHEAGEDESWRYDELDMDCFSLRLPVKPAGSGCTYSFRREQLTAYAEAVEKVLKFW